MQSSMGLPCVIVGLWTSWKKINVSNERKYRRRIEVEQYFYFWLRDTCGLFVSLVMSCVGCLQPGDKQ